MELSSPELRTHSITVLTCMLTTPGAAASVLSNDKSWPYGKASGRVAEGQVSLASTCSSKFPATETRWHSPCSATAGKGGSSQHQLCFKLCHDPCCEFRDMLGELVCRTSAGSCSVNGAMQSVALRAKPEDCSRRIGTLFWLLSESLRVLRRGRSGNAKGLESLGLFAEAFFPDFLR